MKKGYVGRPQEQIIHELNELEDVYAECMKDDVDVSTLNYIWEKIKGLKKELDQMSASH
jgi:Lhr-like helicase